VSYRSIRTETRGNLAAYACDYRAVSEGYTPDEGSLAHFLTARYCLFTVDKQDRLLCGDIRHEPWLLHEADAEIAVNTIAEAAQIIVPESGLLLHYASTMKAYLGAMKPMDLNLSD